MQSAWLFFVLILAILIIVGWSLLRFRLDKPRKDKTLKLLAHTDNITALPEYRRAKKKYTRLLTIAAILFALTIGSVTALAARPTSVSEESEDYDTRDIMLCIDVSYSMHDVDTEVLQYLKEVVAELKGQRIGITLFNGTPILFMPLTNDYLAVDETLDLMISSIEEYAEIVDDASGTYSSMIGSSTVGCINNFDKLENEERSRALILVTDNQNAFKDISITQAAEYGMRYNVVFYNIDAYDGNIDNLTTMLSNGNSRSDNEYEMYMVGNMTGGNYYIVCAGTQGSECTREDDSVIKIVDDIMKQEAIRTKGAPKLVRNDAPELVAIITLVVFCAFFFVIWRVKLWY